MALMLAPATAQASGELFVSSQKTPGAGQPGITGLIQLADGGGQTLRNGAGGSAIAGTGGGPIVYNSGGSGAIKQLSGNSYVTLASGVGGGIRSMTLTGRGLVVANVNKLQYLSNGTLVDVPHGTIADGPWISITTQPNGLLLGWAFHGGEGRLYELNLASGAVSTQDFSHANSPLLNNCAPITSCGNPPVPNSGGISADGQGGIWVAGAGTATGTTPDPQSSQLYYAAPTTGNFSFNSIDVMYTRPHVSATGTGGAYVSSTDNSAPPYFGDVYRFTAPNNNSGNIATGSIKDSYIETLAVDRCYTFCSVSPPNVIDPGATTQKLTAPKKTIKLGKKGLKLKLKCSIACSITVSGKLAFGKAKKATASVSNKIKTTKAKLKAGKSKTVTLKLSKAQRKKVKRALKRKQKVVAKLKIVVKAKGVKTVTKRPKLRVK
jgi:hypothetical protein